MIQPIVSAICLHRGEPWHLEQARSTWAAQLWDGPRELVIVTSEPLPANPRVGERWVWQSENTELAQRRNAGISASSGAILIQWDDDDVSGPNRLRVQVEPIVKRACEATVLKNVVLEDLIAERSAPCAVGGWPQTIAMRRILAETHPYRGNGRGEDSRLFGDIYDHVRIVDNDPALYRYRYHGANVSGLPHWNWLFRQAGLPGWQPCDAAATYSEPLGLGSEQQGSHGQADRATSA